MWLLKLLEDFTMADEGLNSTSSVQIFILRGFPGVSHFRSSLIIPFLSIYLISSMSNGVMTYTILSDKTLHSPMYILISLLFLTNIAYTNTIMPKFLLGLIVDVNQITLPGCLVQMFVIYLAGSYESHLLVLMGLDRYVAIILPLHYHHIVSMHTVTWLLLYGFVRSFFLASLVVFFNLKVQFCRSNLIMNFACENMSLLNLACGDISKVQAVGLWARIVVTTMDGICILASYLNIVSSVRKTIVGRGRKKAWRTCSSHLLVTILTFSCGASSSVVYRMSSLVPPDVQNFISLMNFAIPSCADPIIYGLWMSEIRDRLRKMYTKR
ncbi:olfactory receptor 52K1-like [Dendropsophus ebraccatus]|uniref:olfactory receptor 52K1-like n=1 Tax=Dendropsophus ebraccatus TaxID=150705 RepID=UPI003831BFE7